MTSIDDTVRVLAARLPELAWKLGSLYTTIHAHLLPRSLFKERLEMTPESCIAEIKADLNALSHQRNERSAHYLAKRTSQKINVLVHLCQLPSKPQDPNRQAPINIETISTRQQWLRDLEGEIATLSAQHLALQSTLDKLQTTKGPDAVLNLQSALGEVLRRLTLAKETFDRATRVI